MFRLFVGGEDHLVVVVLVDHVGLHAVEELLEHGGVGGEAHHGGSGGAPLGPSVIAGGEGGVAVEVHAGLHIFRQPVQGPFSLPDQVVGEVQTQVLHHGLVEVETPHAVHVHEMGGAGGDIVAMVQGGGGEQGLVPPVLVKVQGGDRVQIEQIPGGDAGGRIAVGEAEDVILGVPGHHQGGELVPVLPGGDGIAFLGQGAVELLADLGIALEHRVVDDLAVHLLRGHGGEHIPVEPGGVDEVEVPALKVMALVVRIGAGFGVVFRCCGLG